MNEQRGHNRLGTTDVGSESSLLRLAELAEGLGSERVFEEASSLFQRVSEGTFYVVCIGQFKRGKSTLLNALLEDPILPTGVLPVTTVPTVVRYGTSRSARVRFQGGKWIDIAPERLTEYVSEESNPENRKRIVGVEVFCPSRLLAEGMCFVDTPGLGSVFGGNTAATQAFIPHIDAAIVVIGADPPIAGDELKLVEEVARHVWDLILVLNKADKTLDVDRKVASSFTRNLLEKRLNRPVGPLYEISGQERLEHRGPERDWPNLVSALETLARESGRILAQAAGERGLRRLSEELLAIISEERDALLRPIEESEQRIRSLHQTISEAERSLRDIGYLFLAEQHHLSDMFLDARKVFLSDAGPKANAEFAEVLRHLKRRDGSKYRREVMRAAQQTASRYVLPWLAQEQEQAEREYRRVESRFVEIGNEFLKRLSESGIRELARIPDALNSEKGFRVRSRFTFEGLIHVARPASPLRYLADVLLGTVRAFSVIEQGGKDFLNHLMELNSSRVQSDVVGRVQESRGKLEIEIRKLLHEVSRIAERALEHARSAKGEGESAIAASLARLKAAEREIMSLQPQRTGAVSMEMNRNET